MMMAATAFDLVLVLALLASAGLALFLPRRSTAAVMFCVFGVLLATLWARMAAPDVALAEAILGAGVTGALLIDAVTAHPKAPDGSPAVRRRTHWLAIATLAAVIAVGIAAATLALPDSAPGLAEAVEERLGSSGVDHPVTAVLLNFRGYDTLLEVALLAIAALAVLSLAPGGEMPVAAEALDVPAPLDALTRLIVPVVVLFAGWLLVAGSTRPGGAFQSGVLLAGAMILLALTGRPALPPGSWLRLALVAGVGSYLALSGLTASGGRGLLVLDEEWAGFAILALETVLTASIAVALAGVFVASSRSSRLTAREAPR